jgi:hypothetical protein
MQNVRINHSLIKRRLNSTPRSPETDTRNPVIHNIHSFHRRDYYDEFKNNERRDDPPYSRVASSRPLFGRLGLSLMVLNPRLGELIEFV